MYNASEFPAVDASALQLRPLSAGEVFDRTFALYRNNFTLFVGIAALPACISLLAGLSRMLVLHFEHLPLLTPLSASVPLAISTVVWGLLSLAAYGISQAATTSALSDVYLKAPTSTGEAYRTALLHAFRYAFLAILQMLWASWLVIVAFIALALAMGFLVAKGGFSPILVSVLAVLLMLASVPYLLYRLAKISLAMPASVIEGITIGPAFKRSKQLMKERKWRVCLLFLVIAILYLLLGSLIAILNAAATHGHLQLVVAQAVQLLVTFFAGLLLQPVGAMGVTLFYFDERVRQEGFDIEYMMQNSGLDASLPPEAPLEA